MSDFTQVLQGLTIHWFTSDRFDTKPDKSSWTEVGDSLGHQGAKVNIITSFRDQPYSPEGKQVEMVYLSALDLPLIYRVAFTISAFLWLYKNANKNDIVILNQHELWMKPLLSLGGFHNVHLDIRTLPVIGTSLKDRLDVLLFWKVVMRLFSKSCKSYSFITQRLLHAVEQEFSINYDDYTIWQSGVNADEFAKSIVTEQDRQKGKPFTLFYHGSLYRRRGVDRVVEAWSLLPEELTKNSRFLIVGSGSGLDELKSQVLELGLEDTVELVGFVPYESIPAKIAESDVCICPLPDYPEWNVSSPLKVLEYMACARPMILTPIPAHKDVLDGEPFVIWTTGDHADDFVEAIKTAYTRYSELLKTADKAPDFVKAQWDWKAHGRRFGAYLAKHYSNNA